MMDPAPAPAGARPGGRSAPILRLLILALVALVASAPRGTAEEPAADEPAAAPAAGRPRVIVATPAPDGSLPALADAATSEALSGAAVAPDRPGSRREADPSTHTLLLRGPAPEVVDGNRVNFPLLRMTRLAPRQPPRYPKALEELDGATIRIAGFMQAFDSLTTMRTFMLLPTPGGCNFCAPPSPNMVVLVRQDIPEGGMAPFVGHAIEVEGRLKLWRRGSEDPAHRMFLYVVEEARVKRYDLREGE